VDRETASAQPQSGHRKIAAIERGRDQGQSARLSRNIDRQPIAVGQFLVDLSDRSNGPTVDRISPGQKRHVADKDTPCIARDAAAIAVRRKKKCT
jgi:hypothetical protein